MKASINNTLLRNLPEGRDVDIYDTAQAGFVLRLRKSGRHSWRVNYGRGKWYTLGRMSDLTPAEAREQAKIILGDAAKGQDVGATKKRSKAKTLRDYLKNVYAPWVAANLKDGQATAARLETCFDADMGGKRLHEVTPWLVEKWRTARRKAGKQASTINRDLNALKTALNRAVEWGFLDEQPLKKVKPLKVDANANPRYLSDGEETRLRDALTNREETARQERETANAWRETRGYSLMPDLRARPFVDHLRPLVLLALNTGMRRGELFNLKWADIDLQAGRVTVKGSGAKSGKTRHIPLNDEARDVLRGWQETTGTDRGLVFPGRDGKRLDNIKKAWAKLMQDADISRFRFHDTRHTFASKLVMAGVDLNTVRELLGHSDIKMTLRYAHLAPEHKAQAVARLAAPKASKAQGVA